jgi:hypothetical protein
MCNLDINLFPSIPKTVIPYDFGRLGKHTSKWGFETIEELERIYMLLIRSLFSDENVYDSLGTIQPNVIRFFSEVEAVENGPWSRWYHQVSSGSEKASVLKMPLMETQGPQFHIKLSPKHSKLLGIVERPPLFRS